MGFPGYTGDIPRANGFLSQILRDEGYATYAVGKWHVTRCVAIFGSVGDALQARRFADDGYGAGWHPDPPGRLTVAV